jgi:mono/diheme cytochrome c family protein
MHRPTRPRCSLFTIAALLAGCASTPATPLPADVQALVDENCAECHAPSPRFGAPMPLTTWEAMHARARTRPELEVYQLVAERIHDEEDPMPARGMLPAEELAIFDAWIAAGGPPGDGTVVDPPEVEVGPEHLPCEVTHEFRAHAPDDADAPYHLEVGGNRTMCFAFASPFGATTQGTAFAPILDDVRVLHHWIIFGASTLPAGVEVGDVFECGAGGLTTGSQFLQGWAPGGTNAVLDPTIGRRLPGPDGYVILQVHYWNVAGYTDVNDRSGVALCTTETPREHEVATATLGSLDIAIEPRSRDHVVTGTCTPAIDQPVTIVGSGPHMHTRGTSFRTEILRADGTTEMLVDVAHWDFDSQTSYAPAGGAVVIEPGDRLRTTCTYDNPDPDVVTFGERTEDEMCFNFVSAYPPDALTTEGGRSRGLCID